MYYDKIDPIGEGEQGECLHCGNPTDGTYCSDNCKNYDTE
jgi:hypothetical protein